MSQTNSAWNNNGPGRPRSHWDNERTSPEELRNQAACLNLVTNAVVTCNTVYMAAAIEQFRIEGERVNEDDIGRLSLARYEHINPLWEVPVRGRGGIEPVPSAAAAPAL